MLSSTYFQPQDQTNPNRCRTVTVGIQEDNKRMEHWHHGRFLATFSVSWLGVRVEQIGCSKSLHVVVIVVIAYNDHL